LSSFIIYKNTYGLFSGCLIVFQKSIYEILISFLYLFIIPINLKLFYLKFLMYFVRGLGTLLSILQIKLKEYI